MENQNAKTILMIRPNYFSSNTETQESNAFQKKSHDENLTIKAQEEFDCFVTKLKECKIHIIVINDIPHPLTPDAIFPNNWISFHQRKEKGMIVLYPMLAHSRRVERRNDILHTLKKEYHFLFNKTINLTPFENQKQYLEGTGSLVLDRKNKIAYANLSSRTHQNVLYKFSELMNYEIISFHATDQDNIPIYHTNVMMSVGDEFAVICLESIKNPHERNKICDRLKSTNHEIIEISLEQMYKFAGNVLQVTNTFNQKFLAISEQAYNSLSQNQKNSLEKYSTTISSPLDTIENYGGGSARCMMAEIFLPYKIPVSIQSPESQSFEFLKCWKPKAI